MTAIYISVLIRGGNMVDRVIKNSKENTTQNKGNNCLIVDCN